jgi:hypothetical protein
MAINAQSVKIESLILNNKISAIIDFDELKMTEQIDSITSISELMDMSLADSLVYVGNTYFEYYRKTNSCLVGSIIFDRKIKTVSLNTFTLDKNTTLEDFKRMFPFDCSTISPIKIYGDETEYMFCSVGLINSDGEKLDSQLLLFFSKNKLMRIEFWEPS